jgi:formate dehydrogenase major subunit
MERMNLEDGEIVRVSSRRGSVESPVRTDVRLRPGLGFMTFHFPDQVDVNQLTIDAVDEKSGTAEFKACAIKVEKLAEGEQTMTAYADRELVAGD